MTADATMQVLSAMVGIFAAVVVLRFWWLVVRRALMDAEPVDRPAWPDELEAPTRWPLYDDEAPR